MADKRVHTALIYLVLLSLSYRGPERKSLLKYSGNSAITDVSAFSILDFARSSCLLARFPTAIYAKPKAKRYSGQRFVYYRNATATTQFELLKLSGDIPSNPGPVKGSSYTRSLCAECGKALKKNQNGVPCSGCIDTYHRKCTGMSLRELRSYSMTQFRTWYCMRCSLPPLSDSFFENSTLEEKQDEVESESVDETWSRFDQIAGNNV